MATKKVLTLEKLTEYDALIKEEIYCSVSGKADLKHTHNMQDINDFVIDDKLSSTSENPIQNKVVAQVVNEFESILNEEISPKLLPEIDPNGDIYYILRVNSSGNGCEWVNIASDMYIQTWVRPYLLQWNLQDSDEGKVMQVVNGQWMLVDPHDNINRLISIINEKLYEIEQLKDDVLLSSEIEEITSDEISAYFA